MPNLLAYVKEYGHLTFEERPFSPPDSLALTQIVYMPMEGLCTKGKSVTVAELSAFLARTHPDTFEDLYQQKRRVLTDACAASARFGGLPVLDYFNRVDPARETQFCACTFALPDGGHYVAYRGTDLTVAGWKEDLNMSFMAVPAQGRAVRYLERAAASFGGPLRLGGHSKGGHLSLYAAAHAAPEAQARILRAYSFDGQGVDEATLRGKGYARVKDRIESYIPQSSVVGMLLCYHPVYKVVKSSAVGLLQHDALSWQIRDGEFALLDGLDLGTRMTDEALRQWIDGLSLEQRRKLTDTVFRVISALESDTLNPLVTDLASSSLKMLGALRKLDPETRAEMRRMLGELYALGAGEAVRMLMFAVTRRAADSPASPGQFVERIKEKQEGLLEKLVGRKPEEQKNDGSSPSS